MKRKPVLLQDEGFDVMALDADPASVPVSSGISTSGPENVEFDFSKISSQEKRAHSRFIYRGPAILHDARRHFSLSGQFINLSSTGFRLQVKHAPHLNIGHKIILEIIGSNHLPGTMIHCVIANTQHERSADGHPSCFIGLKIVRMTGLAERALAAYVQQAHLKTGFDYQNII